MDSGESGVALKGTVVVDYTPEVKCRLQSSFSENQDSITWNKVSIMDGALDVVDDDQDDVTSQQESASIL